MKKVLVIGEKGYLGSQVVESLRESNQVTLVSFTRSELDMARKETYTNIDKVERIIICAECLIEDKIRFIRYCLERSKIVIESSADPKVIEQLMQAFERSITKGTLLLGMGVFPGISNIFLKETVAKCEKMPQQIDLIVSTSPFSGAGQEMCKLMIQFLKSSPPWKAELLELGLLFPEVFMLKKSYPSLEIQTFFKPMPAFLTLFLKMLQVTNILKVRPIEIIFLKLFILLRKKLFIKKSTPLVMRARTKEMGVISALQLKDGVKSAANALALSAEYQDYQNGLLFPENIYSDLSLLVRS